MCRLTECFHFVCKGEKTGERKANIVFLSLLCALIIIGNPSKVFSNSVVLKSGMPNTITLPNGEVVYDLNGEWDADYKLTVSRSIASGGAEQSSKDIVKITQEGSQFVGIKLIGDVWVGKDEEAVKGKLEKNGFKKVHAVVYDMGEMKAIWVPSKGEISEDGNKIVIKTKKYGKQGYYVTIELNRK